MAKCRMKLFVWEGFCPDYSDGLAFAIARNEQEARKLVEDQHGYTPSTWGDMSTYPVTRTIAKSVSGGG